jgi:hypothetical protein
MKNFQVYFTALIVLLTFTLSSCELVGDIFKAGMWTMLIVIVLIVVIIGWLIRKMKGPRRP